jgi:hypothetical protein
MAGFRAPQRKKRKALDRKPGRKYKAAQCSAGQLF